MVCILYYYRGWSIFIERVIFFRYPFFIIVGLYFDTEFLYKVPALRQKVRPLYFCSYRPTPWRRKRSTTTARSARRWSPTLFLMI